MRYVLIAVVLLSGCTAMAEFRAENAIARFGPYCDRLGYQRDTDQWRACVQAESGNATAAAQRQQAITGQILGR